MFFISDLFTFPFQFMICVIFDSNLSDFLFSVYFVLACTDSVKSSDVVWDRRS